MYVKIMGKKIFTFYLEFFVYLNLSMIISECIPLDKREYTDSIFSYLSTKTYGVGSH